MSNSKLRESLESLINVSQHLRCGSETDCEKCTVSDACSLTHAISEAKAALSAPPRNIDTIKTHDDIVDAWNAYVRRSHGSFEGFLVWLFAEAKGANDEQQ